MTVLQFSAAMGWLPSSCQQTSKTSQASISKEFVGVFFLFVSSMGSGAGASSNGFVSGSTDENLENNFPVSLPFPFPSAWYEVTVLVFQFQASKPNKCLAHLNINFFPNFLPIQLPEQQKTPVSCMVLMENLYLEQRGPPEEHVFSCALRC